MKKEQMNDSRIDVYKWIKIGQAAILMILGALFVINAWINKDNETGGTIMLSISIGIVVAVYGVLDILSGYLLYRNPYNHEVIFGEVLLTLAVILFIKMDIINEILSYFVSIFVIIMAAMFILHGIDKIVGKSVKKSKVKAILAFVLAGIMLGGGIFYLIMYVINKTVVETYMLMVVGAILFILGVASLSVLLIKVRNTKKAMKEEQIKEDHEFKPNTDHPTNTNVKIIDISDLRKHNKKNNDEESADIIVVEEDENTAVTPKSE